MGRHVGRPVQHCTVLVRGMLSNVRAYSPKQLPSQMILKKRGHVVLIDQRTRQPPGSEPALRFYPLAGE